MTRKLLSVLTATTAIGLTAFAGPAAADRKGDPGCRGQVTAAVAQEVGGLSNVGDLPTLMADSPREFQEEVVRPFCAIDPT